MAEPPPPPPPPPPPAQPAPPSPELLASPAVQGYLDAGVGAQLGAGGFARALLALFACGGLISIALANPEVVGFWLLVPLGPPVAFALALGPIVGRADREGIKRRLGRKHRWVDLEDIQTGFQTQHFRDETTSDVTVQQTRTTRLVFSTGSLRFDDQLIANTPQVVAYIDVAVACAQPERFGRLLGSPDARRALAAVTV